MRNKQGQFIKGYHYSPKTEFKKGSICWRKGLKFPPLSNEHKRKISIANIGRKHSMKSREKISKSRIGIKFSKEHRRNLSKSHIGFTGAKSYAWKGGKRIDADGYILIYQPYHPFQHHNCILEHRLIMEKHLKRFLTRKEVVHHKNGNPSDNRLKNLILFPNNSEHIKYHNSKHY